MNDPDRVKQLNRMAPLIHKVMDEQGAYEAARGFLRYEKVRTLNLPQMAELTARNLHGERFDDMIDELILADHG